MLRVAGVLAWLLALVACGRDSPPSDLPWAIAPEDVSASKWAEVCGTEHTALDESEDPRGRFHESWRGNGTAFCVRDWVWNMSEPQPMRHVERMVIWTKRQDELERLAARLFEPMLPREVRRYLYEAARREHTPYAIEARGFAFEGGYKESANSWFVAVKRIPRPTPRPPKR